MNAQLNQKGLNTKIEVFIFLTISLILFAIPSLDTNGKQMVFDGRTYNAWMRNSMFILIFLVNYLLLVPKILFKGERWLYLLVVIALVSIFSFLWDLIMPVFGMREILKPDIIPPNNPDFHLPFNQGFRPRPPNQPPKLIMTINNVLISLLVIGLGTAFRFSKKWRLDEEALKELQKEKLESELAFLKNQISPHFFLNTLNNIHALIDIDKKDSQKAIIKLSNMMRYLLYESDQQKTDFNKEVVFIKSYVDLMKLRISEEVKIEVEIDEVAQNFKLPPLLFIPFIENAFKHGISYNNPSFIKISLKAIDGNVFLIVDNFLHKNQKPIEEQSGIGLENVKKRLDLIYNKNYNLEITENDKIFHVFLKIPYHDH